MDWLQALEASSSDLYTFLAWCAVVHPGSKQKSKLEL
jgi:hypothetical protein